MSWLAIAIGATLGAWLRYGFQLWMNTIHGVLPLGTLMANLVGGFVVGAAVAFFDGNPALSPMWRLFMITGFLGGLTTFSTYSAEAMRLLQNGQYAWALGHSALHVFGSIACCFAGFAAYKALTT